ncbi:PTS sugar transporter subunit IIA [Enterocloster aldenensis]|uniref:BglG family transcription antiterminator n=1 Tax=Enterocloster aldenensis TaxID=358742 RepID=UPI00351775A7
MQNVRQEQLLAILSERGDWMTSRQLAGLLGVSDRTIRSDVEAVNRRITPAPIESNVRQGYRVMEDARTSIPAPEKNPSGPEVPQTPGGRCIYIIQKLLFETRELNLVSLQDQIFVSGYSIDNDLKRIRRMLEPYANLKLVRNRECISLKGDEASKRRFYRDLLVAEVQENFLNMNLLAGLYKSFDLIAVKDIFVDVLEEYDYSIHESMFPMVILHAGTSIERMNCANYVNMDNGSQGLEDTIEYQISLTFFDRISKRLHIEVHDGEVGMFALVIMGKRASNYTSDFVNFEGKWLNTKKLVAEALDGIYSLFGLDFREDGDLIAGLKMHIHGLIDRVKAKAHMQDVFVEEIKRKYPLVFDMGIYVVELLEDRLEASISEVESCYIALHLGAASERINSVRKYRTIMIIPHNQTFSDMCVKKISEMFRERVDVVGTFRYFEEETVSSLDPDLILTTFPLEHKLDVPTVPINLFVDSETESNILQAVNKLDKKQFQLEFTSHIGSLIRKEHFHENVTLGTPEEIIRLLCHGLEKEGIVEPGFKDIVLKREQMSPTSFVNAFAIPHAFGAFASHSTIAVAQLKSPVRWGNFDVGLVMLFAINEGDERMIKIFFDWVSNVVNRPEELAKIVSSCTYEEFIDRIMG